MKQLTDIDELINGAKRIHMIGIGGAGMCPIAEILFKNGYALSGSDNNETDTLARIRAMGIPVKLGHAAENVRGADIIVYSAAIMKDNPERVEAERLGIPCIERSVMLGAITRRYDNVIAVSGTHGKTTVTSMISHVMIKAELSPTVVIGGKLPLINANGMAGSSDTMVCEACEFVDTFLQLSPDVSIILNIDRDHLEYFKTVENLKRSFTKFCNLTSRLLIVNGDDKRTMEAVSAAETDGKRVITFGRSEGCEYRIVNETVNRGAFAEFDLMHGDDTALHLKLGVPGEHNVLNGAAAAVACLESGVTPRQTADGIESFGGASRRFEILAHINGITIADDYAHHPAEIKVTLETAKKMDYKRVWAVFQPFTFSRTAMLLNEFAEALQIADRVVMTDIMGSREINTYGIKTQDLADKIPDSVWFSKFDSVAQYVADNADYGDLIITLGCGDVYKVAKKIIKILNER